MALKKKERVLTPEEFKAKQQRDYAPFWFNSEVIFGANLYPVAESFSHQVTILFLLDVADFATEKLVALMNHWKEKYVNLQWEGILVFQQKYAFLKNQKFFDRYKNQKIFLDTFGELFQRFGSEKEPVAVVLKNGQLVSSLPLTGNLTEVILQLEQLLQSSLRSDDSGLPLPMIRKYETSSTKPQTITPENITTFGEWNGSATLLVTDKNGSMIAVPFKGKIFRLVAMAHPDARDNIKVSILLNEKPLSNALRNNLIHEDTSGGTYVEINKTTGIYDIIHSDTEITGVVKLTFLNAYDNGAVFYEVKIT